MRCKIGRTASVSSRRNLFQKASGEDIVVLGIAPGLGWAEKMLHAAFGLHRMHGEWFGSALTRTLAIAGVFGGSSLRSEGFIHIRGEQVLSTALARVVCKIEPYYELVGGTRSPSWDRVWSRRFDLLEGT